MHPSGKGNASSQSAAPGRRLIAGAADAGTLRCIALGWSPVKLLRLFLAVSPAAGSGMTGGCGRVPPNVLLRSFLSISGSQHDLKFIELIPLGIGPLSVRDRQKRLQAQSRGNRSRLVHGHTISLFDKASLDEFRVHIVFQLAAPRGRLIRGPCGRYDSSSPLAQRLLA